MTFVEPAVHWWARPGLEDRSGRLCVAGRDAQELAMEHGTPLYVFDFEHLHEQISTLRSAMQGAGLRTTIRFAMKANREHRVLGHLRSLSGPASDSSLGIDACSPGEVARAIEHGWPAEEISFTGTNLSDRDLDFLLTHRLHINVDLLSQLRRLGETSRGRTVGLRINPKVSCVRGSGGAYSGVLPTKFGIYPEDLNQAIRLAKHYGLHVTTAHMHVGSSYLDGELPQFEKAVETLGKAARTLASAGFELREINVGGGLGVPRLLGEDPLNLDRWAAILAAYLGELAVNVAVEPGEFIVKNAAVLLAQVVTVEERLGRRFIGLNVGWNALPGPFIYHDPAQFILCRAVDAPIHGPATFTGNINEGDDVFASDQQFPAVIEGDFVAILAVGAYNQAQSMCHCLRRRAETLYFDSRI